MNDRPVKMVSTPDGRMDVLAVDMATGELRREMGMLSRALGPGGDVDELDEAAFEARVAAIRNNLALTGC